MVAGEGLRGAWCFLRQRMLTTPPSVVTPTLVALEWTFARISVADLVQVKGLGFLIVVLEIILDCSLELTDTREGRHDGCGFWVICPKKRSTWLIHELDVGVKCMWNLGCFCQPFLHCGMLVGGVVVDDQMQIERLGRVFGRWCVGKRSHSWWR